MRRTMMRKDGDTLLCSNRKSRPEGHDVVVVRMQILTEEYTESNCTHPNPFQGKYTFRRPAGEEDSSSKTAPAIIHYVQSIHR